LKQGVVTSVVVDRKGDETLTTPDVPLAGNDRPLVVTTRAEIAENYERPEDFLAAGWTIEEFGEQLLLTRCQDVFARGAVLAEIQDHQLAMARAAKPHRTKYYYPKVAEDEKPVFEVLPRRIEPVGINQAGLVEWSCILEPGEHLRGHELLFLREITSRKVLRDGTPLTAVRVVFLEAWMAESEKRPLIDIGVRVYFEDSNTGELVEITD
jgi:hypothetical protein